MKDVFIVENFVTGIALSLPLVLYYMANINYHVSMAYPHIQDVEIYIWTIEYLS